MARRTAQRSAILRFHLTTEAVAGQENEAYKIAQRIGQRQNFGRHAALGAADGLALSPPFAPCPWRWTLTMVASTMAYRRVGAGLENPGENIRFDPVAVALENSVPIAEQRRKITPRASRPHYPKDRFHKAGSVGLPRQCGSIFAHWASVSTNRSIQSLNHNQATGGILILNRP